VGDAFKTGIGRVLSADIAVPAYEQVKQFYVEVLTTGKRPLWHHNLLNNHHTPIIGLGKRTPAHEALPVQWMPHIQVADVAVSAARALELGARELMKGKNYEWAVLSDPGGAAFGIVPVVPSSALPKGKASSVGRILWLDLTVSDAAQRRDFYRDVIGWTPQDIAMREGVDAYSDYSMLAPDETPAAGVCHARGENAGLPSAWMIYLPVADLAESVRRVPRAGGRVIRSIQNGDLYAYAAVEDPAGACLALVPEPGPTD
jgi:predicted enzyme related to lactoylglutathione lyase